MVNILQEVSEGKLRKGLPKRLTLNGETKTHESYLIPIEYLFYNDLNGRIATYIQEYNDENGSDELSNLFEVDREKYNEKLSNFVKASGNDDMSSFNRTKEDIHLKGQQIPGVVLADGRIIDGNRRFTAIRDLYKETGDLKFAYFEAVVLDTPQNDNQWKSIKTLELYLQFNVDEKRDYNRIDYLVSFYRDVIETKIFDEKTYIYASGIKKHQFNKDKRIVEIMLDYLEWRNKPKAFYILKNEKLDGPIEEIAGKTSKMSKEEWNAKKNVIYTYMTFNQQGDRTRDIRELLISAVEESPLFLSFQENIEKPSVMVAVQEIVEEIDKPVQTTEESVERFEKKKKIQTHIENVYKKAKFEDIAEKNSNKALDSLEIVLNQIKKIDKNSISSLSNSIKKSISNTIEKIQNELEGIINETK